MADSMPWWAWALIAVVAIVIIIAVIFAGRRDKDVDARHQGAGTTEEPLTPRRGLGTDEMADLATPQPAASPGRRLAEEDTLAMTDSHAGLPDDLPAGADVDINESTSEVETRETVADALDDVATDPVAGPGPGTVDDLDEDTLHAPLTIPEEQADPGPPEGAVEDFTADQPVPDEEPEGGVAESTAPEEIAAETDLDDDAATAEQNAVHDLSAPTPSEETEEAVLLDEAEVVEETEPDQLGDVADLEVEESRTDEVVETVDLGEDQGDIDAATSDIEAPQYADRGDYGDPYDDDIPRDDMGRRLDPYGNPVDNGPDVGPVPPSRV